MKAYTDLEQSKKLAEILPHESADMEFMFLKRDNSIVSRVPFVKDGAEEPDCSYNMVPCWSLAALLDIIPKRIKKRNILRIDIKTDFAIWYDELGYGVNPKLPDITMEEPIDACYEMIIELHEGKML